MCTQCNSLKCAGTAEKTSSLRYIFYFLKTARVKPSWLHVSNYAFTISILHLLCAWVQHVHEAVQQSWHIWQGRRVVEARPDYVSKQGKHETLASDVRDCLKSLQVVINAPWLLMRSNKCSFFGKWQMTTKNVNNI